MFAPKAAPTALVLLYDAHEAGAAVGKLLRLKNQVAEAGSVISDHVFPALKCSTSTALGCAALRL